MPEEAWRNEINGALRPYFNDVSTVSITLFARSLEPVSCDEGEIVHSTPRFIVQIVICLAADRWSPLI